MSDSQIIAAVGLIVSLIAIVAPVIKLNNSITLLNANFESMMRNDEVRDRRIEKHGEEIDGLREKQRMNEKILDIHELRIGKLEDKTNHYE